MRSLLAIVCLSIVSGCDKSAETATAPTSASKAAPTTTASSAPKESASAEPTNSAPVASASASAATAGTIELVPKVSFGPILLGASKKDIDALGVLKVHPQYSGMTIPYTVYYDAAGNAKRIQLSFKHAPSDVKIGTLVIPRTATYEDVKALLKDCKDEPPAKGGTTSKCRGGTVNVSFGSGSPTEVWLEAALP